MHEDLISPPVILPNAFTEEEISRLVSVGERLPLGSAYMIGAEGQALKDEYRRHRFSLVAPDAETAWFFEKLGMLVGRVNAERFGFDLRGIGEPCQFNVYRGDEKGHIDWHTDRGYRYPKTCRKMTVVVQLSPADAYEGGALEIRDPLGLHVFDRSLGSVAVFPSFLEHRVAPVTRGKRMSMTIWYTGPSFR